MGIGLHLTNTIMLIGLLISVDTSSGQPTSSLVQPTEAQRADQNARHRLRAVRDASRDLMAGRITMPEAIRRAGGYLSRDVSPGPDARYINDIYALVTNSPLVISGRSQSARARLSDDKSSVVTEYTVVIDRVLRGARSVKLATLTVDLPGGTLHFAEGTFEATGGPVLNVGERYVLFLQPKHGQEDAFVITGTHREGLFHADAGIDGVHVRSSVERRDLPLHQFDGQSLDAFARSILAVR